MDSSKKAAFVKTFKRQKFSKGGMIRKLGNRKHFAEGGQTFLTGYGPMTAPAPAKPTTTLTGPNDSNTNQNASNPNTGLMGNINAGLGLNNNFQATSANIQQGTNATQLNNAYTDVQNGLAQQQGLADTLNPQAASGVASQNALAKMYMDEANGQGPNPAQHELAQNTAANVAQTGAQMAGMRGASGNVGLMARNIGQQGAATQQASAGQAATLQAQQQIAAQQNAANLANNQISQAGQATTGLNSAQQNEQSILQNANTSANNANVGMQSNINNVNSQTAAANQNMASNTLGGLMSAASNIPSMAKGGVVHPHMKLAEMNARALKHFDEGGEADVPVDEGVESNDPDLGTFKTSIDSASAPNVGATAALPANSTNLSNAAKSSGGSGGSGGGIMSLAALMADGGQIQTNPLVQPGGGGMGSTNWAQGYFNPGSASSGPNIGNTAALPSNGTDFSKSMQKKQPEKKPAPKSEVDKTSDFMHTPDAPQGETSTANWMSAPSEGQAGTVGPASGSFEPDMQSDGPASMEARGGNISQGPHKSHVMNFLYAKGGSVPAMVSPGEVYLSPDKVARVIQNGEDPAKIGEKFKGRAKVKGDSLKNDVIPKTLEEGGVVVDRKHMGTAEKRKLFVHQAIMRKKAGGQ